MHSRDGPKDYGGTRRKCLFLVIFAPQTIGLNKGVSKLKSGFTPKVFHFWRTFSVDSRGIRRRNPRLEWRLNRAPYSEVMGTRNLKKWSETTVTRPPEIQLPPISPKITQFGCLE